jgi:GNAT superfamily N-acetyltransferase
LVENARKLGDSTRKVNWQAAGWAILRGFSERVRGKLSANPPNSGLPAAPGGRLNRRMIDMLVRLYDLADSSELYGQIAAGGVVLRRARAFEKHTVADFARTFSEKWASEVEVAATRQPVSCFIATRDRRILGFSCYDTTHRGFFGPTGVVEDARGLGLGKALLMKALEGLRDLGHAYAIIGGVGPREFYEKNCGAIEIPGSDPGTYVDLLP